MERTESKIASSDAEEKAELQLEKQTLGDERLKELELQCKSLDEKLWESQVETMATVDFYDRREKDMQDEISRLMEQVEALNKNLDKLKLKYNKVIVEKDEIIAEIRTLRSEASSRHDRIRQMEGHMRSLNVQVTSG